MSELHAFFLKKQHSMSISTFASFGLYRLHFHCMSNAFLSNLETIKPWMKYVTFSFHLMLLSVHMCLCAWMFRLCVFAFPHCHFSSIVCYDPKRLPRTADPGYGLSQLDSSGDADAQACDAQINALMDRALPPSLGAPPSSSGATSKGLSGGFGFPCSAAPPSAKAMPRTSTSVTRPCPTSTQGGQVKQDEET